MSVVALASLGDARAAALSAAWWLALAAGIATAVLAWLGHRARLVFQALAIQYRAKTNSPANAVVPNNPCSAIPCSRVLCTVKWEQRGQNQ